MRPAPPGSPLSARLFDEQPHVIVDPQEVGDPLPVAGIAGAPLVHHRLAIDSALMPRVIDMRQVDATRRGATLDAMIERLARDEAPGVQAVLASSVDAQALASSLSARMVVDLAGAGPHLLRFWDPLVFVHLCWMLPAPELRRLTAPVQRWTFWVRAERACITPAEHACAGLASRAERERAILDIETLNAALREIDAWGAADLQRLGPELLQAIGEGRSRHGLHEVADLGRYAAQKNRWGAGFDERPEIRSALAMTRDGETSYVDALSQREPAGAARAAPQLQDRRDEP